MTHTNLTPAQLEELMARYYGGEKVSDLIKEFCLPISSSKIVSIFPPEILQDQPCPYCAHPMSRARHARNAPTYIIARDSAPVCSNCNHVANDRCRCKNCAEEAERKRAAKEAEVCSIISDALRPKRVQAINVHELTLKECLYLVSVARAGLHEDGPFIRCLDDYGHILAPTTDYCLHILSTLYERKLIDFSPYTPASNILSPDYQDMDFQTTRMEWQLDLAETEDKTLAVLRQLEESLKEPNTWPTNWRAELTNIWTEIAEHESLWYLVTRLHDHNFPFRVGEKTRTVIRDILRDYSIAQIYNFIWSSARDAASYYMTDNVPRHQAANSVVGKLQRKAERAKTNGYNVQPYRRDYRCPETIITSIFSYVMTSLGDEFFTSTPSDDKANKYIDFDNLNENPTP